MNTITVWDFNDDCACAIGNISPQTMMFRMNES
jgi:hypothetical protein